MPGNTAAEAVRILGIDPGLRVTGFGVLERRGQTLSYVASGVVRTLDTSLPERLKTILDSLARVIAQHAPDQVAVEQVFVNVNPQSTLRLGQARGAAICAAVACGLPVAEYTALQVKQAVVGNNHAARIRCRQWCAGCCACRPIRARTPPMPGLRDLPRTAGRAWAIWPRPAIACATAAWCESMIGRLTGILLEKHPPQILLDVQGVAYEIDVP